MDSAWESMQESLAELAGRVDPSHALNVCYFRIGHGVPGLFWGRVVIMTLMMSQ